MVKVGLVLLCAMAVSLPMVAQAKSADYAVKVHVSGSRIGEDCGVSRGSSNCSSVQILTVAIDGAKYELESETLLPKGIVALGDYPAKLTEDQQKPTHEFTRAYELKFPDGSARKFRVIGQTE